MAGRSARRSLMRVLWAALRLRCPRCGRGRMFSGPFKMLTACPVCRLGFEPEQGFYVGAIYINYAATMAVVIPGYFVLDVFTAATINQQLLIWGGVTLFFPVVFFRHSRSLWLALTRVLSPA